MLALPCAALVAGVACSRTQSTRVAAPAHAAEPSVRAPEPQRLPEDPVAGKRSEQQWHEHLKFEEEERQLGYDKRRLKQHEAVVALIGAARTRYDRARNEAALAKVRAQMPARLATLRQRVVEIDRWGVSSRVLGDYDALAGALAEAYPAAKLAALKGDPAALGAVRADFDQHLATIGSWLEQVRESEGEEE